MDIRKLTDHYYVSPQISAEDLPAIRAAGFGAIICNRPDAEVPPSHQAAAIRAAAEAEGLTFHVLELTHQTMTPNNIELQSQMIAAAGGPVLAYCASGTRSSVVWALGQAGKIPADDILAQTQAAGYQLDGLRPLLQAGA